MKPTVIKYFLFTVSIANMTQDIPKRRLEGLQETLLEAYYNSATRLLQCKLIEGVGNRLVAMKDLDLGN
jgi:hypothetical protein